VKPPSSFPSPPPNLLSSFRWPCHYICVLEPIATNHPTSRTRQPTNPAKKPNQPHNHVAHQPTQPICHRARVGGTADEKQVCFKTNLQASASVANLLMIGRIDDLRRPCIKGLMGGERICVEPFNPLCKDASDHQFVQS
jgi:hypothetical protein